MFNTIPDFFPLPAPPISSSPSPSEKVPARSASGEPSPFEKELNKASRKADHNPRSEAAEKPRPKDDTDRKLDKPAEAKEDTAPSSEGVACACPPSTPADPTVQANQPAAQNTGETTPAAVTASAASPVTEQASAASSAATLLTEAETQASAAPQAATPATQAAPEANTTAPAATDAAPATAGDTVTSPQADATPTTTTPTDAVPEAETPVTDPQNGGETTPETPVETQPEDPATIPVQVTVRQKGTGMKQSVSLEGEMQAGGETSGAGTTPVTTQPNGVAHGVTNETAIGHNPTLINEPDRVAGARTAEVIRQVTDQLEGLAKNPRATLHIQLQPEELGRINLRLTTNANGLRVTMFADQAMTRDLLENNLSNLRSALADAGINLSSLNVSQDNHPGQGGYATWQTPTQTGHGKSAFTPAEPSEEIQPATTLRTSAIDYRV